MPITTEPPANPLPVDGGHVKVTTVVDDMATSYSIGLLYATSGAPVAGDLAALAEVLAAFFGDPTWVGNLSNEAAITEVEAMYSFGGGTELVGGFDTSQPGLIDTGAVPLNVALVASLHTGERYRGGKSRIYVAGCPDAARVDLRQWTNDFVSAMQDGINAVISGINGATSGPFTSVTAGVWHKFSGGAALAPPVFAPYESASIQRRLCTQRRRLGSEIS
jgi:hypothetical protein